jgi:uncharacterized protein (DUF2236 family)
MVKVPRESIPPTVPALRAYIDDVVDRGELLVTDSAKRVAGLFRDPPLEAEWRPVLKLVSPLAFSTLPPPLREMYGVHAGPARRAVTRATFAAARAIRPLLPARYRFISPYQEWRARGRATPPPRMADSPS